MHYRLYLGLGSNIGDRVLYLRKAVSLLKQVGTIENVSSIWETKPVGFFDQAFFLNAVVSIETSLDLEIAHQKIIEIEWLLEKSKLFINGPRTIDIDILYADGKSQKTDSLIIPHPRMWERLFVLLPLKEIMIFPEEPLFQNNNQKVFISDRIYALQKTTEQEAQLYKAQDTFWWQ